MVNKVRTIDFLPEIFKTSTNRQFLDATLDVLTAQPDLRRVQGFIGEKYGYGVEPTDKYVVEPTKARRDYQLDPGVIFLKEDTQTPQDFINYPGILAALKSDDGLVNNHDRLFNSEFYSWDPFVDYDKLINYSQYYWLPQGPDAIPIQNTVVYISQDYTVTGDDNGYKFSELGGVNPVITLLRGGTYEFQLYTGATAFWLQTVPGIGATPTQRNIPGVVNNGGSTGAVTFTVPDKITFVADTIYYQSGTDPNSVGVINFIESNTETYINVDDILGRKTYTSPNGIKFTNGLKVYFNETAYPEIWRDKEFYVEGVGSSIVLLPVKKFIAAESTGETVFNPWDYDSWDLEVWGEQLYVPVTPEYITVTRNSRDYNAWTRANRWFNQEVLDTTKDALGYITQRKTNNLTRAQRPIIEYRGNLRLFNTGLFGLGTINILDSSTRDAFSEIEGKTLNEIGTIGGQFLFDGARILFVSDTNPLVRQNIYVVKLVPTLTPGVNIVNLVVDPAFVVTNNSQVTVLWLPGVDQAGATWWFNSSGSKWSPGQTKTSINQYPLYDLFDVNGYSLADNSVYSGSTFAGCPLFTYTPGTGQNDPVLGFPIAYSSLSSIGDILFTIDLNSETFSYNIGEDVVTNGVNAGYVHWYNTPETHENLSGWVTAAGPSFQYQVFEFPIIKNLNYSSSNIEITVTVGGTNYSVGDQLKITGDLLGGTTPENDLYFTVSSVSSGVITGISTTSIKGTCVTVNNIYTDLDVVSVTGYGASAIVSVKSTGNGTTDFVCDVVAKTTPDQTPWNPVVVYFNDNIVDETQYTVTRDTINKTTNIKVESLIGVKITALLISSDVSGTAYYQTPINLENNPFNTNPASVSLGDLKNQFRTIFSNAPGITGQCFGSNNVHDLGNLNKYGVAIIQNSASLVLPGLFLRKPEINIFEALQYNSQQYQTYKNLLVELATTSNYSVYGTPSAFLDDIIYQISTSKSQSSPFFWSDMVFSGNPYTTTNYTINGNTNSVILQLSLEVWTDDMYSTANYRGIGIYLIKTVNNKQTELQLIRGVDYVVSTTPGLPSVTINYNLELGDTIVVKQYNQTYGSYCPNTPSKLGLYPIYIPAVIIPQNAPGYYILGHDGSLNKLWGTYVVDPLTGTGVLNDFRDQVLLEFEKRVYNNFKVSGPIPLQLDDIVPGQFRTTEYSWSEILDIYTPQFLNWIGDNRLDYKTQYYVASNKFTYNYGQSNNKVTGEIIEQGYWKGLYRWLYDTANPAQGPWEMLGFTNKPSWWDSRYGAAPYTSGNTYMWSEIAEGYVWNDGQPYINPKRVRPNLLQILPVTSSGTLVNPFDDIVGNYNSLTFNSSWKVGDGAPVESSYLASSAWPFDAMRLLALAKPAQFFNLFVDRDLYKYNSTLLSPGQYLYNERYHLDPKNIQVYGDGVAKHSYINWVVDYNYQRGANGKNVVTSLIKNTDVRLVYSVAGFTSKNYLKFLVEKATPNSRNTSLLIPDENYSILLYDNPADTKILYSSVVIQKTREGWLINGNSKTKKYFTTLVPKPVLYKKITVGGTTVQVYREFYTDKTATVPYGTLFYSVEAVGQFLQSYGGYLREQGVIFDNIIGGVIYDWERMIQEFIAWSDVNWEIGSLLVVNPSARTFSVNKPGYVPQPLTIQGENFILNQNLVPIQSQNMYIERQNEALSVKILSPADTVSYCSINLNTIEHAIIFDNYTSFNDTIYNLTTGLRQSRLLLQGYKTGEWAGYINTNGFILNENNVKEWQPNTKYPKNIIVTFKNKYYTAKTLIEPKSEFSNEDWLETDYGQIKAGLLPNTSTSAYESLYYYDTTKANLENDADLLSFSLIGFRPRDYMVAADLSDITQVNVYQNIIREKGTKTLLDSFKGAQFDQGAIDYEIYENWAIRGRDFGSVLNNNFIEAQLLQSQLTGNPTLIGFANPGSVVPGVQLSIPINTFINWERPPVTNNFLPRLGGSYVTESGIPSAGYVNTNDSKFQIYSWGDINDNPQIIGTNYSGNSIWIANYKNSWNIFTSYSLLNQIQKVQNNLNGTITVYFVDRHGLIAGDMISIVNLDPRVNGFYEVKSINSLFSIIVELNLETTVKKISGSGSGFKLHPRRYEQASSAAGTVVPYTEWSTRTVWVDFDTDSQWAVWNAAVVYKEETFYQNSGAFGISVAYTEALGKLAIDGAGKLYRYWGDGNTQVLATSSVGAGSKIVAAGSTLIASSPDEGKIYIYKLDNEDLLYKHSTLTPTLVPTAYLSAVTGALALSADAEWLYIGDATTQQIAIYNLDAPSQYYKWVNTFTDPAVPVGSGWATSLATAVDGSKLVVGAPYETVNSLQQAGAVYVYNKRIQKFYGDGTTITYTLKDVAPNNIGDVYVDDAQLVGTYSILGTSVSISVVDPLDPLALIPAPDGSLISVSTGYVEFEQKFVSDQPHLRGWFGLSVDTNRYGAEIVAGVPYEISTVGDVLGVEGAVYRYTNGGKKYGVVTTTITGSHTGYFFVNGYLVNYSGSITDITGAINGQTPTNIIATANENTLTITVKDFTPVVVNNIIDITGPASNLDDLGITPYTKTQVLKNHNLTNSSSYGYTVKMSERDSLLVTALNDVYKNPTTFDYTPDCIENDTIIDYGTTTFVDSFSIQGVVYMYDYLPAYRESISNPGQYAFGQYISTANITAGTPQPKFGYSLAYVGGTVVVGAPGWSAGSGGIALFSTAWTPEYSCQIRRTTSWGIDKKPLPIVDINLVNTINVYDTTTNETLDFLDYTDPMQGKFLGAIATNVDLYETVDPAVYGDTGISWTWDHLGDTWLDLNTIRLLNYHQPDFSYNAKNWGRAFPGSTADIYTWVESVDPPLNYSGSGFPLSFDKFNTATTMDNSTNSLVTLYYFWVKNYDEIPKGKTLSPIVASTYILNPLNSGISFLAPITTNIVGLYNCGSSIQADTSALHLGYGLATSMDDKHVSWSLIRDGDPEDFLTGLPLVQGENPAGLYLKFLESFSGYDYQDNLVPDPRLPALSRYGTLFRPRQSMFIDRLLALKNYIVYANNILIKLPIVEIRSLSFLQMHGVTYDVRKYWKYVNWWADGYNDDTKAVLEVDSYNDLQTLTTNSLLSSVGGTNLFLTNGLIVKVKNNLFAKSEYYLYSADDNSWTRIGAENTTIQILPDLYALYGWATEPWGGVWDKNLSKEITYIVRWLNEQCYIDDLSIEKNRSLILMFKFIQSEALQNNNYLPWLNKTSLIDVNHRIRSLLPYKKYQRDNQEFLSGFINEVKPFHVLIKDFIFTYTGEDTYFGNLTDFDLPAQYVSTLGGFQTPQLVFGNPTENNQYTIDNFIWSNVDYKEWFANWGLSISGGELSNATTTSLAVSITASASSLQLVDSTGLPAVGVITIGGEDISYDGINPATNTLYGLFRGANSTTAQAHTAGEPVSVNLNPVVVYDTGRGYLEPPLITAYIDTTVWPEPRVVAQFVPVMAGGRVIGINLLNGGSGYAVTPQIKIPGSSILETVDDSAFNIVNNTITITGHPFVTGDTVVYICGVGSVPPAGLEADGFYYVRVLDANTVALYLDSSLATVDPLSPYLHVDTDDGRVDFKTAPTGVEHTFNISARAICLTSGQPVREFKVKMKFDRISYGVEGGETSAVGRIEAFYQPTLRMPGKNLPQLMVGVQYPNNTLWGDQFRDRWDWTNLSVFPYDGILDNPPIETILAAPSFTSITTNYDVVGDEFGDGYTPEELVGGYISDSVVITITTNDTTPEWNHTISIDKFGDFRVFNNSGIEGGEWWLNRWWYGVPGTDPYVDPSANTTLTNNIGPYALFLKS